MSDTTMTLERLKELIAMAGYAGWGDEIACLDAAIKERDALKAENERRRRSNGTAQLRVVPCVPPAKGCSHLATTITGRPGRGRGVAMTDEQKAAYVHAQAVAATAEIEGMKVTNIERAEQGHSFAHDEQAFLDVIERYGLHHNAVLTVFAP